MSVEPVPDWIRGSFTAADLDHLPELPAHTELIDGSLVFVSPQKRRHMELVSLLQARLTSSAPGSFHVMREMSVILSTSQRPEPDVMVIDAAAVGDGDETWYPAEVVHLVVEVVSPESQERDRERKPQLYARAGIPHFWRVESDHANPVVYVYELDPATSVYALTGIHHDRLKVTVPWDIEIDLTVSSQAPTTG